MIGHEGNLDDAGLCRLLGLGSGNGASITGILGGFQLSSDGLGILEVNSVLGHFGRLL